LSLLLRVYIAYIVIASIFILRLYLLFVRCYCFNDINFIVLHHSFLYHVCFICYAIHACVLFWFWPASYSTVSWGVLIYEKYNVYVRSVYKYIQQYATIVTLLIFQELYMFLAFFMPIIMSTLLHRQSFV
jgi:hypothetical protein